MIDLTFASPVRSVLALGAHPDDIEIGCGGTLLELAQTKPGLLATVCLLSGSALRRQEAEQAAALFLPGADRDLRFFDLPDSRMPQHWGEVKTALEALAADLAGAGRSPDLILAPRADDAHQDHRLVAELVPTVWRDHLVLGYEIPKWDGDLGRASVYVPLSEATARAKAELLGKAYPSQVDRDWWDEETFLGLARLRGIECRSRYAEAFTAAKTRLTW